MDYAPSSSEEEAGVTVFLTQNHHLDLGVVMLPSNASTLKFPGSSTTDTTDSSSNLIPQLRFRGVSYTPVPDPVIVPVPQAWIGRTLRLEIKASNMTHYSFSAGPANALSEMQTVISVSNQPVSYAFTGKYSFGRRRAR